MSDFDFQDHDFWSAIEQTIFTALKSIHLDIVESNPPFVMHIANALDGTFKRFVDAVRKLRNQLVLAIVESNCFQDLFQQVGSEFILLRDENQWLRAQADNAIIKAEYPFPCFNCSFTNLLYSSLQV